VARTVINESKPDWCAEKELWPGGDPDVRYLIRSVSQKTFRRFRDSNTTKVLNRRTHTSDTELDGDSLADALLDYALVDWEGVLDEFGKKLPCELEFKQLLPAGLIAAIGDYAIQAGGAVGRTAEERKESFRTA
jgi:hypothetical protein